MKCLVTGGAGFIGSHLVDRLIADGHEVHVWDDLSTSWSQWRDIQRRVGADYFWANRLGDPPNPSQSYDWIFHLAGRAALVPSIDDPEAYVRANVNGTVGALENARLYGCRRFIYASSSSIYGDHPFTPTGEFDPPQPAHPYAMSKYMGELAALHWMKVYRLPVVSLRLFNVYGPRARTSGAYGAVMGTFLAQRANGMPLTVVGTGEQRRDFVWVEDVADAFVKAAQSDVTGVYNIGTGQAWSINRLAAWIGGPIVRVPARGGEPEITLADASKAARDFGWVAQMPMRDGIARLLANLGDYKTAPVWTPDTIAEATKHWHQHLG